MLHAGAALLLLVVATTLAIYKPRGMTRYGQRNTSSARCSYASCSDSRSAN
jgi:hypothetical protein